jgi:hypothetical protein
MLAVKIIGVGTPLSMVGAGFAAYAAEEGMIPALSSDSYPQALHGSLVFVEDTFNTMRKGWTKLDMTSLAGNTDPIKYERGGGGMAEQLQAMSKKKSVGGVKVQISVPPGKLGVTLREQIGGGVVIASIDNNKAGMADIPLKSQLSAVDKTNVAALCLQDVQTIIGDRFLMRRELELICKADQLPQSHRCHLDFAANDVGAIAATDLETELATLRTYEGAIKNSAITSVGGRGVQKLINCIADRKHEVKTAMRR